MTTPNNETAPAAVEPQYQMVPDTEECSICIENFTNIKRKKVVCAKCNYSCCKQCCQEYLISTTNEHQCPNCKTLWDNEFLYENTMNRIKYIVNEYSESKFKTILSKQNVKRNKNYRILQILELVNAVCIDNFNQLQEYLDKFIVEMKKTAKAEQLIKNFEKNIKNIDTTIGNFNQIRMYCNDEFEKIAKQYNNKPMIINDNMQLNTY